MEVELVEPSPGMFEKKMQLSNIPYDEIPVGMSIAIPFKYAHEASLRAAVSTFNAKSDVLFKVKKHSSYGIFEVCNSGNKKDQKYKFELVPSSPQAMSIPNYIGKIEYPFEELSKELGVSFAVPFHMASKDNLEKLCKKYSKKLKVVFAVIPHESMQIYEIANLPMTKPRLSNMSTAGLQRLRLECHMLLNKIKETEDASEQRNI